MIQVRISLDTMSQGPSQRLRAANQDLLFGSRRGTRHGVQRQNNRAGAPENEMIGDGRFFCVVRDCFCSVETLLKKPIGLLCACVMSASWRR